MQCWVVIDNYDKCPSEVAFWHLIFVRRRLHCCEPNSDVLKVMKQTSKWNVGWIMYLSLFQWPLGQGRHLLLLAGLCVRSTVNNGFVRTNVARARYSKCLDRHQPALRIPVMKNVESIFLRLSEMSQYFHNQISEENSWKWFGLVDLFCVHTKHE